jgi:hypothetical protein
MLANDYKFFWIALVGSLLLNIILFLTVGAQSLIWSILVFGLTLYTIFGARRKRD